MTASSPDPVRPDTIAFVPPRFGPGVIGGAEAVLAEAAMGMASRGHNVEILTTCAKDHFTWANVFEPGVSRLGAGLTAVNNSKPVTSEVLVRRFAVELDSPGTFRDRIGCLLYTSPSPRDS